jgi:photosystem II stability/assembly factor-like uncharacterized protein
MARLSAVPRNLGFSTVKIPSGALRFLRGASTLSAVIAISTACVSRPQDPDASLPAPASTPAPVPAAAPAPTPEPRLVEQASGTRALLQAVSVVNSRVVWVSGHAGTWVRTLDGGTSWQTGQVAGHETLQFRDVHALSADTAWLMSAGDGEESRIFRTTDGGISWTQQHVNPGPGGFFDCMDFWDSRTGIVFSDEYGGEMFLVHTDNAGADWRRIPPSTLPAALSGEGSFAASGHCLVTVGDRHAWIGLGNASATRVLITSDRGRSWRVAVTPIVSGEANGIAAIAFRDTLNGVALGGEIGNADGRSDNVAITSDGGRSWTLGGRPTFTGAVYGGTYVPGARTPTLVAVSPKGVDISTDEARSWSSVTSTSYWSAGFASPSDGWLVGPGGRITHVRLY